MAVQRAILRPAAGVVQSRGFASEKDLRDRLRTVGNISKVTKAMNMVAAAKVKKHQVALEKARNFNSGFADAWPEISEEKFPVEQPMVGVFTSDRGLCGGVNGAVLRDVRKKMTAESKAIFTFGGKAKSGLQREYESKFQLAVTDLGAGRPAEFPEACEVAASLLDCEFDEMEVVYNKFMNIISFDTRTVKVPSKARFLIDTEYFEKFEIEGDELTVFDNMYEFMLATRMFEFIHETQTSEQSSRMTAMDNSSTNADEMYEKLLLQANRLRQAKITKELMEIVGGMSAVVG